MIAPWEGALDVKSSYSFFRKENILACRYSDKIIITVESDLNISLIINGTFVDMALYVRDEYLDRFTLYVVDGTTKRLYYLTYLLSKGINLYLSDFTEDTSLSEGEVTRLDSHPDVTYSYYTLDLVTPTGVKMSLRGQANAWTQYAGEHGVYNYRKGFELVPTAAKVQIASFLTGKDRTGYLKTAKLPQRIEYLDFTLPSYYPDLLARSTWGSSVCLTNTGPKLIAHWDGTTLTSTYLPETNFKFRAIDNEVCIISYTDTYHLYRYNAVSKEFEKDIAFNVAEAALPSDHRLFNISEAGNVAVTSSGSNFLIISLTDGSYSTVPAGVNYTGHESKFLYNGGAGKPYFLYFQTSTTYQTQYHVLNTTAGSVATFSYDLTAYEVYTEGLFTGGDYLTKLTHYLPPLVCSIGVVFSVMAYSYYDSAYPLGFIVYTPDPDTGELTLDSHNLDPRHRVYHGSTDIYYNNWIDEDCWVYCYLNTNSYYYAINFSNGPPYNSLTTCSDAPTHIFRFSLKGPDGKRVTFVDDAILLSDYKTWDMPDFESALSAVSLDAFTVFIAVSSTTRYVVAISNYYASDLPICNTLSVSTETDLYDNNSIAPGGVRQALEGELRVLGYYEMPDAAEVFRVYGSEVMIKLDSGRLVNLAMEDIID